jgi:hypothetical protein
VNEEMIVLRQVNGNKKKVCRIINNTNGFEKICPKNLRNWLNEGGRQGMKSSDSFEIALKNLLVFNSTMNGAPEKIVTICFDYNLIRTIAFELREVPPFNLDEKLGKLKFKISFKATRIKAAINNLHPPCPQITEFGAYPGIHFEVSIFP